MRLEPATSLRLRQDEIEQALLCAACHDAGTKLGEDQVVEAGVSHWNAAHLRPS